MVGYMYVTAEPVFVSGKLPAREASSIWDFWKITFCNFTAFSPFWLRQTFVFLDVLNKDNHC